MIAFDRIKGAVLTAFFPERCPYCGKVIDPEQYACESCKALFPDEPVTSYAIGGYRCVAPFEYKDNFAEAVKAFKFRDGAQYAKPLAFMVVQALLNSKIELNFDFITCVPMHREQQAERGFNQSELLAKECAKLMDIPYTDALEKFKKNKLQHTLSGKARLNNVKGVYRAVGKNKPELKDKKVLLIDDIVTTGSTLGECSKVLIKAGCKEVLCAVVCDAD